MSLSIIAYIRKNDSGEIVEHKSALDFYEDTAFPDTYLWEEGNFACDCNREIFFNIEKGVPASHECTEGKYSVNLKRLDTGEIFYREFEK